MRRDLVDPLPDEQSIEHQFFTSKPLETGGVKLTCVNPGSAAALAEVEPAYCISETALRLTIYPSGGMQILRNRLLHFQGRIIPAELKIVRNGVELLSAQVDTLESIDASDDSIFTAPAGAEQVSRRHCNRRRSMLCGNGDTGRFC